MNKIGRPLKKIDEKLEPQVSIRLPREQIERLDLEAKRKFTNRSTIIRQAVYEFFANLDKSSCSPPQEREPTLEEVRAARERFRTGKFPSPFRR